MAPRPASTRPRIPSADAGRAPARPLLLTGDPLLLDELLRIAALAGVEPEVAADPQAARSSWAHAPFVLVGQDLAALAALAAAAVRGGLPRRAGVSVVGTETDDPQVWERAVALGAERVMFLPDAEDSLVDAFLDGTDGGDAALVIGVVGGRGGAGASTTAAALALSAARAGRRAVLVDADARGGGLDLALGAEDEPGLRWPDLGPGQGRMAAEALRSALPVVHGVAVLSWDRAVRTHRDDRAGGGQDPGSAGITTVLGAAGRGSDVVVVDLPRHLDTESLLAAARAHVVLLVVPAEVRAVAAAGWVATSLADVSRRTEVLVRSIGPAGLPADAVAEVLGLPLAGTITSEPGLSAALERGQSALLRRGSLARFCSTWLERTTRQAAAGGAR